MPYSGNYPGADVRANLETIRGLLLAVETLFAEVEAQTAADEADTLSWNLAAARGACALAGQVLADEATDRHPGAVVAMR